MNKLLQEKTPQIQLKLKHLYVFYLDSLFENGVERVMQMFQDISNICPLLSKVTLCGYFGIYLVDAITHFDP